MTYKPSLPVLVQEALELAHRKNFQNSCIHEVGQLLRLLVAGTNPGLIAEIGTGCGVSSAWMLCGLQPNQGFVSIENNLSYHQAVSKLFVSQPRATFLCGDWSDLLVYQPFQFVFVDVGDTKDNGVDRIVEATTRGGIIVLDDFTPLHLREDKHDVRREKWLNDSRLLSTEVLTTPTTSALLAVRRA
jgi:predicted O-methyltransferase YrrM